LVFPFTQFMLTDQSYYINQVWPLEVGRTRFVARFYFRSPPSNYVEQLGEVHMMATSRDLVSEDSEMTSAQYRRLRSGGVKQLHLGENELLLRHFHATTQAWLSDAASYVGSDDLHLPR
jgi:hypothetical protein